METITVDGVDYIANAKTRYAAGQVEWAKGILDRPEVIWPNGRSSHEAAEEVLEKSIDTLLDHLCLVVRR